MREIYPAGFIGFRNAAGARTEPRSAHNPRHSRLGEHVRYSFQRRLKTGMSEPVTQLAWTSPPDRAAIARDLTALVLALAVALLLVGPSGNFPLLDDWSFAAAVHGILADGTFRPTDWTAMTLIMHTLWGSAFSLLAGYSFDTLRFSTIVLAFAAVAVCYLLARELALPRWLCLLTAATVASTPFFVVLSVTFMTDIAFLAAMLATALSFVCVLRHPSWRTFAIAIVFMLIAILIRQLAIALPLAFALINPFFHRERVRNWLIGCIPLLIAIAAFAAYQIWLGSDGRLPADSKMWTQWFLHSLTDPGTVKIALRNIYVALVYLGWFLLPLSIAIIAVAGDAHRVALRRAVVGSGLVIALLTGFTRARDGSWPVQMPTADNILVPSGLGTPLLRDQYLLRLDNISPLPNAFWLLVTALGLIGATLLLALLTTTAVALVQRWRQRQTSHRDGAAAMLLVSVAAYLFPVMVTAFFDRYLLTALPLLAAGIAAVLVSPNATLPAVRWRCVCVALLAGFAFFSIAGTHDYLAWNRLRWQMLGDLMQQRQLTPAQIDGGSEFNGLLNYRKNYVAVEGKSNWWVDGDDWMIGFGAVPGYDILERRSYQHWLPGKGELVVLRKQGSVAPH